MTKYKAIGDSVIVSVPEMEKVSTHESGFIIITDNPEGKKTVVAEVISVGEGKFDQKNGLYVLPPVNVGDKIIMNLTSGFHLEKGIRMLKTEDIFAIVRE